MTEVFIALGSNQNNPVQQLQTAARFLLQLTEENNFAASSIYRSLPIGPQDQPDFYNAVCKIQTTLSPQALLQQLLLQEKRQHRVKTRHWGERTIDLDILLFGTVTIDDHQLTIPHKELTNRLFVLLPLIEIAANVRLPNQQPLQQVLQQALTLAAPEAIPLRQQTLLCKGTIE